MGTLPGYVIPTIKGITAITQQEDVSPHERPEATKTLVFSEKGHH